MKEVKVYLLCEIISPEKLLQAILKWSDMECYFKGERSCK